MPDEKKSRYTPAQARAIKKYEREKVDGFRLRLPKGMKAAVQEHAAAHGESLNGFCVRAIRETMERENQVK